jgi:hypothetical protein
MSKWSQLFSYKRPGSRVVLSSCCLLVPVLLSILAYLPILRSFFTGTDAITLIESSRIDSFEDFVKTVSRPLMDGTPFVDVALFYRPLASLSYALDYLIWGLNPFGYQLTNLILHALVTLAVAFLVRSLAKNNVAGLLAATIFAMHPILVESVPAVDRRHDLIAGLFVVVSLAMFIRANHRERSARLWQVLSLASYCLALGGKEIAVILPGLIFTYAALFQEPGRLRRRLTQALKMNVPYGIVTLVYMMCRILVLDGIGGYLESNSETVSTLGYTLDIIRCFFQDLLDPADFWGCILSSDLCIALVLLPFIALCVLAHLTLKRQATSESGIPGQQNTVIFLLVWIVLPLAVFSLTKTFAHRSMYAAAIPFSALVAIAVQASLKLLRPVWPGALHWAGLKTGHFAAMLLFCLCIGNTACLVSYSPLFHTYQHWNDSARISATFLDKLAKIVGKLPKNSVIHICDLPEGISSYNDKYPRAKEVTYIRNYSIKSWLDLRYPGNTIKVLVHRRTWPRSFSGYLDVKTQRSSFNAAWMFVSVQGRPPARLGMNSSGRWRTAGRHYF